MDGTKKSRLRAENHTQVYRDELTRLHQVEFGTPMEFFIRTVGTLLGAAFVESYTGWNYFWHWVALVFVLQMAYYLFLNSCLKSSNIEVLHLIVAQLIFLLILGSFVSVPALMMTSQNDAFAMTGFCIFGSMLVFMVRRSESSMVLAFSEVAVFFNCGVHQCGGCVEPPSG